MSDTVERKKSPNLVLTEAEGNYVIGSLLQRFSKEVVAKGRKFIVKSALIRVEDTNGSTVVYDAIQKENVEVSIDSGDTAFLKETSFISKFFDGIESGTRFKLVFDKIGKAKKGQNPPYKYTGTVLGQE